MNMRYRPIRLKRTPPYRDAPMVRGWTMDTARFNNASFPMPYLSLSCPRTGEGAI